MSSGAISLCPSFPACLPGAAINKKLQLEQAALLMQRPLFADAHPMKKLCCDFVERRGRNENRFLCSGSNCLIDPAKHKSLKVKMEGQPTLAVGAIDLSLMALTNNLIYLLNDPNSHDF